MKDDAKIESIQAVDENSASETRSNRPIVDESIDNVEKSTTGYLKRHIGYVIAAIAAAIILEATLYFLGVPASRIYALPLLIPIVGYGNIKSRIQHEFMQQFAAANGFAYSGNGSLVGLDGVQFRIGYNKSASDYINGTFENCPISLFSYQYTTGYGRDSSTYNAQSSN